MSIDFCINCSMREQCTGREKRMYGHKKNSLPLISINPLTKKKKKTKKNYILCDFDFWIYVGTCSQCQFNRTEHYNFVSHADEHKTLFFIIIGKQMKKKNRKKKLWCKIFISRTHNKKHWICDMKGGKTE